MATAAEVLGYFRNAEVGQATLVLELASAELESRAFLSNARSQAAKKRWRGRKASDPAPIPRKRRTFSAPGEVRLEPEAAAI